jgi:lipopolysaccharide exporter
MGLFKAAVLLALVVAMGQIGPLATCAGVGVAFAIYGVVFLRYAVPDSRTFWAYLKGALPPLLACIPMVAAVAGVRWECHLLGVRPSAWTLLAEIAAGGGVYLLAALTIARTASRDFLGLLAKATGRAKR